MRPRLALAALVSAFALVATDARAIVFDSTDSTTFNTTAPTGLLADSGWQYQGNWGGVLGTTIAPNYFITVQHVGGNVGDPFYFNGTNYYTTAYYDDPNNSELRIWQISGTFSTYAPLYTASDEVGKGLVVFGRGATQGAEVVNGTLRGWMWNGNGDGNLRWGENTVTSIVDGLSYGSNLLGMEFNHGAGDNEATLGFNDSGGGVFISDNGVWKLAGLNSYVDAPYSLDSNGAGAFNASLFNADGYYNLGFSNSWEATSGPGMFYATRVSSSAAWIQSVIVPEPSPTALAALGALGGVVVMIRRRFAA